MKPQSSQGTGSDGRIYKVITNRWFPLNQKQCHDFSESVTLSSSAAQQLTPGGLESARARSQSLLPPLPNYVTLVCSLTPLSLSSLILEFSVNSMRKCIKKKNKVNLKCMN